MLMMNSSYEAKDGTFTAQEVFDILRYMWSAMVWQISPDPEWQEVKWPDGAELQLIFPVCLPLS